MTTSQVEPAAEDSPARLESLRARLVPPMPGSAFWGWAGPLLITILGGWLRFDRLGDPRAVIFDETYYAADAFGILKYGVEHNYSSGRNTLMVEGNPHIFTPGGEFVVHPPFGKELIAVGEWMFGLTPFGWRFATAVVGSLSILMIARIARRMTRSDLLGCAAGLLLAMDGLELVMSRTALLDIFVMFWALAAFGCLVVDRDAYRAKLADAVEAGDSEAPRTGIRWWRVGAGVCLGLACASKWNGVWFIPAFGLMCLAWDLGARRTAGFRVAPERALMRDAAGAAGSFALVPFAAYLATWSGWLATSIGYDRQWAQQHGLNVPVISDLVSWYQYQKAMLAFNTGLRSTHPYMSKPWTWLFMSRPVSYYWVCTTPTGQACPKDVPPASSVQEVIALGTPVLWWSSILAIFVCLAWWLTRRDWRAGAALLGVAAGWLPWFMFAARTQFYFYAVAFVPFLVLCIVLCLGLVLGPVQAPAVRRAIGASVAGAYMLGVLADFAYMYPLWVAKAVSYSGWLSRIWYHGWI